MKSKVQRARFKVWIPTHYWLIALIFLCLVPYPLFHGLDSLTLRLWDEARRGVNAFEMLHNGNLLVSHYNGSPDMWGTKPTLLVILQAGLMWLLGPGELAVRLPSALAGLATCLALVLFSAKYLKNPWFGLIWSAVLITFNGYVDFHGTRTGDFDALLTLFMFLYAVHFFLYTQNRNPKHLLYTFIFITLAVLTKGIGGLLFLPALLIWVIITKSLKELWSGKYTWIGAGIFILIIGGYYAAREMMNPGYLQAVAGNELGGRYFGTLEGHRQPALFYVYGFIYPRLQNWAIFIIPGLIAGFFIREKFARNLHLFSTIVVITHLLVISFSTTKLFWYDLPEYPFIALTIANLIWSLMVILQGLYHRYKKKVLSLLPLLLVAAVFYEPVRLTFKEAYHIPEPSYYLRDHEIADFLREGAKGKRNLDSCVLVHEDYDANCLFYLYLLIDKGQEVTRKNKEHLQAGERIIAHQENVKKYIEANYHAEVIDSGVFVRLYAINDDQPIN